MGKTKAKNQEAQAPEKSPDPAPATDSGNLDNLAADIAAQAPEAQPGVMAAYAADESQNVAPAPQDTPKNESTESKKRGRPRKADSELKEPRRVKVKAESGAAPGTPTMGGNEVNKQTAELATTLKESILVALIGPEWQLDATEKAAENTLLTASLDKYAPDGMPVNPLVMYAAVSAGHAAKRFHQPNTQTWWQKQKTRVAAWWLARKLKKENRNATHSDNRAHNVGENNAGNTTGGQNQGQPPANHP